MPPRTKPLGSSPVAGLYQDIIIPLSHETRALLFYLRELGTEADVGRLDGDIVPTTSCLAQVPTNNEATQLNVQHALMLDAKMNEFSFFRCGARGAEMLEHCAKVYTHIYKLARLLNMRWCSWCYVTCIDVD